MTTTTPSTDLAVYWQPGCSSCLKAKEFLTGVGLEFESVNVIDRPEALDELAAAGFKGVPVIRKGTEYIYGQSLDDIATFVGVTRTEHRLPTEELAIRWGLILDRALQIVDGFDPTQLQRAVIPGRDRTIRELCSHSFQVVESFLVQVVDDTVDARAIYLDPRHDLATKEQLTAYVHGIHRQYSRWLASRSYSGMPSHRQTYYGVQPTEIVLERSVWHATQHVRQLDVVAAGMGAEFRVPGSLYAGLPLPQRLWA